jgi:regulator of protease activity HflC (stomatin/prohibitin superfamily)
MSFIESLAQKGISFVEGVGKGVQFVGARAGVVPVQWPHDKRPGLVWKIPEPESVPASERVTTASIFSKHQPIVVREYERAIVLQNGAVYAEMPAGIFDLTKIPIKGALEIIWVSLTQSQHRWGVGGVMSSDGITVGAFGSLYLQISDPTKFVMNLVTGQQMYTEDKIEAWVKNLISGVMRRELAIRDVRTLMMERDAFVESCKQKIDPLLSDWGLGFKHIELVEVNVPPEYRDIVQKVTLAGFGKQTSVINAQAEAEVLQIKAQAEANAKLMSGTADVQILALMQAHGLDPVKMEMIKVLMEYAKTPSAGSGGMISGDLYKPQVFGMLSQVLMDPTIPADVKHAVRQTYPQQSAAIPMQLPTATPAASTDVPAETRSSETADTPLTAEKIQQTLDNLDMQLAEGKLSESTYNRLREKWETRLRQVSGR